MWSQDESFLDSSLDASLLLPKQLLPPALDILPREVIDAQPMALMPMLPLPVFQGKTPLNQPLQKELYRIGDCESQGWIGEAFRDVIYRRFGNVSYHKIDSEQNWNLWVCDIDKMKANTSSTKLDCREQHRITFQSRFEGGNLSAVSKVSQLEYNLLLQNDTNTRGHVEWFFFKVKGFSKGQKIKFNILNFEQRDSLFAKGMKPAIHSKQLATHREIGWHRGCQEVQYFCNGYSLAKHRPLHTLSFVYEFEFDRDELYISHSYPYNYSDLMNFLSRMTMEDSSHYMRRSLLCKSVAQNRVDLLTITDQSTNGKFRKMGIVLIARTHPGEASSSFSIAGIIKFLLSEHPSACKLRQYFVFKIIPMLNPDGIIHGNSRCSITGVDLNKRWKNPDPSRHPEVYHTKRIISEFTHQTEVVLCMDFHGHKHRKNQFCYGCDDPSFPSSTREFPFIMSKMVKWFDYSLCGFSQPNKRVTLREVLWKELKISNVFTMESSVCGPEDENHFCPQNYQKFGAELMQAILTYFRPQVKSRHLKAALQQKAEFEDIYCKTDHEISRDRLLTEFYQTEFNEGSQTNSEGSHPKSERRFTLNQAILKKYYRYQTQSESVSQSPSIQRDKKVMASSVTRTPSQCSTMKSAVRLTTRKTSVAEIRHRIQDYRIAKPKEQKKETIKMPTKCFSPAIEFNQNFKLKEEIVRQSNLERETYSRQANFRTRNVTRSTDRTKPKKISNPYERLIELLKKK